MDFFAFARSVNGESRRIPSKSVTLEQHGALRSVWVDAELNEGFLGDESIVLSLCEPMGESYVAIVAHSPFWCSPFFGKGWAELPQNVQMLLVRTPQGNYRCYLPVCADTFKTLLRGGENGMEAVLSSNCDGITHCDRQLSMILGEGENAHALVHDCCVLAAKLLGNGLKMREERRMPEMLEYLGWCSWDALQYRISHAGLLEKAREFSEKEVPVHFAILDDMWAEIPDFEKIPKDPSFREMVNVMHQSRIRNFDGDPVRFPDGMAAAIRDLKDAGIPSVGLWYPTTGYWKGYYEDSDLVREIPESFMHAGPGKWHREDERIVLVKPEADSANRYFDTVAARARSWGIDFIKVDNQGYHRHYRNFYPIGQSARAIQSAIDRSADTHFSGALINCMGMPSECMFNRPTSGVSRCSDDFMPESREWFAKNILQCAYNGLLQGQYYVNDWDMFWTDDEQAIKNSVCRAISGGPVYVSDKIGRTRPEVLTPVCLSDGRILRPDLSAVPTADCVTVDPRSSKKPFKIFNRVGEAAIVAAFNVDEAGTPVCGRLSAADACLADGTYAYYEYFTQTAGVLRAGETLELSLADHDVIRLYTLVPLSETGVTVFGRNDLYVGVRAIESFDGKTLRLSEGGRVAFLSDAPISVQTDSRTLKIQQGDGFFYVEADRNECILQFLR